jgi:hypothetical protein
MQTVSTDGSTPCACWRICGGESIQKQQSSLDGADIGTDNVHLQVSLDSTVKVLSGTFESTVKDPSGNPLFTATGTFTAAPI